MTAEAPLPGPATAAAASGPLPSEPVFASAGQLGMQTLRLGICPDSVAAARRSIGALTAALESLDFARDLIANSFPDVFDRAGGDVFVTFGGNFGAGSSGDLTVLLKPSDRYLELVAVVAAHLEADIVTVHHWPILSIDGAGSPVSSAAGESNSGSGAPSSHPGEAPDAG